MSKARSDNPIFVAIDTPDLDRALALAHAAGPYVGGLEGRAGVHHGAGA